MPNFGTRTQTRRSPARGVRTIRRGIGFLQAGDYDAALREFRRVAASKHPRTTRLVKAVANGFSYHTEVLRKEAKKARFGNAHLIDFSDPGNSGEAWSDVDIAMVLVAPSNRFTTRFLASFLNRSPEAVRFQRRYAFSRPLSSWVTESGSHYTRFTQTQRVARRLGLL